MDASETFRGVFVSECYMSHANMTAALLLGKGLITSHSLTMNMKYAHTEERFKADIYPVRTAFWELPSLLSVFFCSAGKYPPSPCCDSAF
jgi:hypothetical protein